MMIHNYEDLMKALDGKAGKSVEFIVKREVPKEKNHFNYLVRKVDIDNILVIDENGVRK